jgi:hypothetical protein
MGKQGLKTEKRKGSQKFICKTYFSCFVVSSFFKGLGLSNVRQIYRSTNKGGYMPNDGWPHFVMLGFEIEN